MSLLSLHNRLSRSTTDAQGWSQGFTDDERG